MVCPILVYQLHGDGFKLFLDVCPQRYAIPLFQRRADNGFMLRPIFPKEWPAAAAGIRYIKHIAKLRLFNAIVYENDALGAAPDIPPQAVIPCLIVRTGSSVRALGVDLDLFVERIFIEFGGAVQKGRPPFQTACDLTGSPHRQFCVLLNFAWHVAFTSWVFMICLRWV